MSIVQYNTVSLITGSVPMHLMGNVIIRFTCKDILLEYVSGLSAFQEK